MNAWSNGTYCNLQESLTKPLFNPKKNTVNPCFIASTEFLVSAVTTAFAVYQLLVLMFHNFYGPYKIKYSFGSPFKLKSVGILQLVKLNSVFIQCILLLVLFAFNYNFSNLNLNYWNLQLDCVAIVFVLIPFHVIEPTRSPVACASLLIYWSFKLFFNFVVLLQDLFSHKKIYLNHSFDASINSIVQVIEIALFANSLIILCLETVAFSPSLELVDYYEINNWKIEAIHNFYSELVFFWIEKTIRHVNKTNSLTINDVEPVDISMSNEVTYSKFIRYWNPAFEKAKQQRDKKLATISNPTDKDRQIPKVSLFFILTKMYWFNMLAAFIFDTLEMVFNIIQTFLLQRFIQFFTNYQNELTRQPEIVGFAIASGIFVTSLLRFTLFNQYFVNVFLVRFSIQSQFSGVLYRKALRLSSSSRKHKTSGDIVNNLSTDVFTIANAPESLVDMLIVPLRLVMAMAALIKIIGLSTWAGIISAVILVPILSMITTSIHLLYEKNMKIKDSRVRLTSEILTSIKSIKLFAWEKPLLKRLFAIRNDNELVLQKRIGLFNAVSMFFWKCLPFVISCSCLVAYCYFATVPLIPSVAFPALSLFQVLTDPLLNLPYLFAGVVQTNVSLKRLRELISMEETEDNVITRTYEPISQNEVAVELTNASFVWETNEDSENPDDSETKYALKDINFKARKGQLTCIVGRVGSGKSTLLKSLLGQLPIERQQGTRATVNGTIAYCAQDPWIMNATVKENILFGCKLNKAFYQMTVEACQLTKDFEVLPDGDKTVVGEKGISLSGGQKARVALARAVYSRADVILLDDVLSAVDAHVCKKIINEVLGRNGLLSTKTVILATNTVSVLHYSHEIVMVKGGQIYERGSLGEVMTRGSDLTKLIDEFGRKEESEEETKEEADESTESGLDSPSNEVNEFHPAGFEGVEAELQLERSQTNDTRKASIASFSYNYEEEDDGTDIVRKTGLSEEKGAKGRVKWSVYLEYFKACNYSYISLYVLCYTSSVAGSLLANYILKYWSELNLEAGKNVNTIYYLALFCGVGMSAGLFTLIGTSIVWTFCSISGSIYFHEKMANCVTRAPMSFFETTPVGRIINRFSEDINVIDSQLIWSCMGVVDFGLEAVGYLVVIIFNLPSMSIVVIFLFLIYNQVRKYYIPASRELKRLNSASKSPIFAHLQESISGVDTLKAYDQQERFIYKNTDYIDKLIKVSYSNNNCNRWLSMRLQAISATIIYATTLFIWATVGTKRQLTPGLVGFVMINAMGVTGTLNIIIRFWANMESNGVAVERIIEYCKLPPEAEPIIEDNRPPAGWPDKGSISFNSYSTRYRENLDPVLKNISIDIRAGEKVGIVGRTGAGKSTLSLSLFRLIEATEGNITIDDIDIGKIGLYDLRRGLNIIPQDANAVEGSVRQNLDPLSLYTDEQLWKVLELAHLKDHIAQMKTKRSDGEDDDELEETEPAEQTEQTEPETLLEVSISAKKSREPIDDTKYDVGLSAKIFDGGSNLSTGQRQLLSLARSLLNPSKVLILDEATAAVDVQTDKIIQKTIREEFLDKTILTIAHRLETVLDSDKVLVLDKGEVKEYDSPKALLSDKTSEFYSLCMEGGHLQNVNIEGLK